MSNENKRVTRSSSKKANKEIQKEEEEEGGEEEKKQEEEVKTRKRRATTAATTKTVKKKKKSNPKGKEQKEEEKEGEPQTTEPEENKDSDDDDGNNSDASVSSSASAKPTTKKKASKKKKASPAEKDKKPKKKKQDHQRQTERDETPKLWDSAQAKDSYTMKICSWNVAGLRALLRNRPTALSDLVTEHNIDVLCLQETKLQEAHLEDPKQKIRGVVLDKEGYDAHYSCSTAKKGYSGTAVYIRRRGEKKQSSSSKQTTMGGFFKTKKKSTRSKGKKKDEEDEEEEEKEKEEVAAITAAEMVADSDLPIDINRLVPTKVGMKMGVDEHDQEGRLITVDFPDFSLTNVYVPNAGQKLERLEYRTKKWDPDFCKYMTTQRSSSNDDKKKEPPPVFWLGDLNIAHTHLEVWNDGAKHLSKQAGVTKEERESFTWQLESSGFVDVFRTLHPTARGCYSYWSQRAGNREPNKGLRLDYFVCSPTLMPGKEEDRAAVVRDSYILYDVKGSDHCPVMIELELRK